MAAPKKLKYTPKEKRVYQAKTKEGRAAKKPAAPRQNIMHKVWADGHTGIDQKKSMNGKLRSNSHIAPLSTMEGNTVRKKFESVLSQGGSSNYPSDT